jgi:EAL domain-containing protein (putative c-di-GMP-specific phosphodiesterase class I)
VRVALDDFDTGFSSLAYVPELPVHVLKLDRAFVTEPPHDRYSAAVVRAVLALAASLDLEVIAEGIETREQLAHLRAAGCPSVRASCSAAPRPPPRARPSGARGWPEAASGLDEHGLDPRGPAVVAGLDQHRVQPRVIL